MQEMGSCHTDTASAVATVSLSRACSSFDCDKYERRVVLVLRDGNRHKNVVVFW